MGARPTYGWLGEETGGEAGADPTRRWIVDPLDGTTNFLHGIPHWAISVGVEKRRAPDKTELVAGVIYNPASDEMFWAEKGVGAFLNDKRLRVSGRKDMREALFATGIPFGGVARKAEFSATLHKLMPQVAGVRRFGAAALDLARRSGDDRALVEALHARKEACPWPAGRAERLQLAAEMLALARHRNSARTAMWGQLWRLEALVEGGQLAAAAERCACGGEDLVRRRRCRQGARSGRPLSWPPRAVWG
jgi:hypothetical protein